MNKKRALSCLAGIVITTGGASPAIASISKSDSTAPAFSIASVRSSDAGVLRTLPMGLAITKVQGGKLALVDRSMLEQGIVTEATTSAVKLSWDSYGRSARYIVTRDGKQLASLAPGVSSFQDTSVSKGASHRYGVVPILQHAIESKARTFSMLVQTPSTSHVGASGTKALARQASSRANIAAASASTTLTWTSFIATARIDAPPTGCKYNSGYAYGGDNHGFDWRTSSNRTTLNAVITWSSKSVASYRSIGTTHVYRKSDGALIASATAPSSGLVASRLGYDSSSVDVRMVTRASNPFCTASAIDGAFTMHLTRAGNWSINNGNHRVMPSHYVYIYDGGQVHEVYRRSAGSPFCLSGACAVASFVGLYGTF